jgi:hypothetical protein
MITSPNRHRLGAASLAILVAAAALPMAAHSAEAQKHDHGASTPAQLSLDHGRKWSTDAALRAGMGRIRALVEPQLSNAHAGKLSAAQYVALASRVEAEVGGIVANCKLAPQADAMLHLVLGEIGTGTDAMAGKVPATPPQHGLAMVAAAINDYQRYFDHPGFEPIRSEH